MRCQRAHDERSDAGDMDRSQSVMIISMVAELQIASLVGIDAGQAQVPGLGRSRVQRIHAKGRSDVTRAVRYQMQSFGSFGVLPQSS